MKRLVSGLAFLIIIFAPMALASTNNNEKPFCTDSDGGENYSVKGILKTNKIYWLPETPDKCAKETSKGVYIHLDSCSEDNCYIIEYACNGVFPTRFLPKTCPLGCNDGACTEKEEKKEDKQEKDKTEEKEGRKVDKLSINLSKAKEDKAGIWYVFGPGKGNANPIKDDWVWIADLNLQTKKDIKEITLTHNLYGENYSERIYGEAWSTNSLKIWGKTPYPLVVYYNEKQLNRKYNDELGSYEPGKHTFKLYGQKEKEKYTGVKLVIIFKDGSKITSGIEKIVNQSKEKETSEEERSKVESKRENEQIVGCNGCLVENTCYAFGTRKGIEYCDVAGKFVGQKERGEKCNVDYMCSTNYCGYNLCAGRGILDIIRAWWNNLFKQ